MSLNFGRITQQPCITDEPPVDNRCDDKAFALANPDACPPTPRLMIKPGVALTCVLGSLRFSAFTTVNGVETDVTQDAIFNTSDPNIMVVGALSGNATGLSSGSVTITASYQGLTAFADVTVLASTSGQNCCDDSTVAMLVLVDRTKSMGQAFNATYPTKLAYAKSAATRFISEVNQTKDTIGLMQFTADSNEVLAELTNDKVATGALVTGIIQTQQSTSFYDAIVTAVAKLTASTANRKMLVLISDGQNEDADSLDSALQAIDDFKSAGGIVLCLGVRAAGIGYSILSSFSTGGFLINSHNATASISLDYLSGLKGYVCAGNCAPAGDEYAPSGSLNFNGFSHWDVVEGHVDLVGNGFMDLLPGNGLYLDMAGSRSAYKGRMVSKTSYAIESGKTYTFSALVAGNQRVDATANSIRLKVFSLNSDGLVSPSIAPTAALSTQSGVAAEEVYEYAYSYQNTNGETPISPASDAVSTTGAATFQITVNATTNASATVCRFWKRLAGTSTWYLIGESDGTTAQFIDTLNDATLHSQLASGALDGSVQPVSSNLTGTPIVHLSQQSVINDYTQDFLPVSFSFTAPYDANVYLSIQQTDTPSGYDATGLLVDRVKFANSTDLTTLLDDDFDDENVQYIPPACGLGTTPILVSSNCYAADYMGEVIITGGTCENDSCGAEAYNLPCSVVLTGLTQGNEHNGAYFWSGPLSYVPTDDDFPTLGFNSSSGKWTYDDDLRRYVSDTLLGNYTLEFDGTGDSALTINVAAQCALVPLMTSNTEPSGVASGDANTIGAAFTAFDKQLGPIGWFSTNGGTDPWLKYEFPTAKTVLRYRVTNAFQGLGSNANDPHGWVLEGSNDNSFWDEVDSQLSVSWSGQQTKEFGVQSPGSYKWYRLTVQYTVLTDVVHISELEFFGAQSLTTQCNFVPEMTSATEPSGEVTDSGGFASVGFSAFDRQESTAFAAINVPGYVQYEFDAPKTVYTYRVTNHFDVIGNNDQDPDNWTLEGSNNGSDWDTIATEPSVMFTDQETLEFDVASPASYKFYRFSFNPRNLGPATIQELELIGDCPLVSVPTESSVSYCLYNFSYLSGYNCYGEGCLSEPPAAQTPDPNPLPDVEAGFTPPTTFNSTKQACVNCTAGFVNGKVQAEQLYYRFAPNPPIFHWRLADAIKLVGFSVGVSWDFPGSVSGEYPPAIILQGSNGTGALGSLTWVDIGLWDNLSWVLGETKFFDVNSQTAYKAYRIIADNTVPDNTSSGPTSTIEYIIVGGFYGNSGSSVCKTASSTSESSQADADAKALTAATLLAQGSLGCVSLYSSTQSFTATCPAGLGASVSKTATRYSLISQEAADQAALEAAQDAANAALDCEGSNNTQQITINDRAGDSPARATPYASVFFASGYEVDDTILKVTVTLNRFNHGNYADVAILLVSPEGTGVMLMANCMDAAFDSTERIITIDDDAATPFPESSRPAGVTHSFKPTVYVGQIVPFPSPAPNPNPGPFYETTLASLAGENPNGAWQLFVLDDTAGDSGYILFGWTMQITLA